ncbi:MarR family winged helix-turn-helix transcriptional regulator [Chromohalobacter israelensis]|uniref:MarR family winged helix-turn-helix transcriptional regulator n=1 Tax=Chromohalobacter israelensis TaxID=141390 RepID=UPI000D70933C|nr:MarR family transcriptional regulator [Chromohalobacter salexigens]PWW32655.1 MarR family transcriptional regulator [Chromohalobacter salexigens]
MNDTRDAGDAGDWLRLDRQLCFPLYAATNLIQRLYRPLLAPLGLTYSQYLVLLLLWEHGSASVGELRDCLHLDAGTITPLLKRMERDGLVTRRRDSEDERRVIVALTPHSAALREQAQRIPETLAARIDFDASKAATLHHLTTSLVTRLQALVEQRGPQSSSFHTPHKEVRHDRA